MSGSTMMKCGHRTHNVPQCNLELQKCVGFQALVRLASRGPTGLRELQDVHESYCFFSLFLPGRVGLTYTQM
jgi:hypothetical protein